MTIRDLSEVYDLRLTQFKAGQWPVLYRSWAGMDTDRRTGRMVRNLA